MLGKIKKYDGSKSDSIYFMEVTVGFQKSELFGHTQVVDKRGTIEIPIDPRAWTIEETFTSNMIVTWPGV